MFDPPYTSHDVIIPPTNQRQTAKRTIISTNKSTSLVFHGFPPHHKHFTQLTSITTTETASCINDVTTEQQLHCDVKTQSRNTIFTEEDQLTVRSSCTLVCPGVPKMTRTWITAIKAKHKGDIAWRSSTKFLVR